MNIHLIGFYAQTALKRLLNILLRPVGLQAVDQLYLEILEDIVNEHVEREGDL